MTQIKRGGPTAKQGRPRQLTDTANLSLHRRQDGYQAPAAEDRREAALLAELCSLGYGITVPCLVCGRPLTSNRSLRLRVGPVCAGRVSTAVVPFDARAAARLTEQGLAPVDIALTFAGIAAEAKQVAR